MPATGSASGGSARRPNPRARRSGIVLASVTLLVGRVRDAAPLAAATLAAPWTAVLAPRPLALPVWPRALAGRQRPQPLHPRQDAPLPLVEPLLDVEREDVSPARGPDAERDRHRVVVLVADRDRDPIHPQLVGPARSAPVEAHGRLSRRQPLDLDVAPADPSHPEAEHLRDGLLRGPAPREGLGPVAHVSPFPRRQDAGREARAEAPERLGDPGDLDDVDPELGG